MSLDHYWDSSLYPSATTVYNESSADTPTKKSVLGVKLSSESLILKARTNIYS